MKLLLLFALSFSSLFSLYEATYNASTSKFDITFDGKYDNGFLTYKYQTINLPDASSFYNFSMSTPSNQAYFTQFITDLNTKFGTSYNKEDIKNSAYLISKDPAYSSYITRTTTPAPSTPTATTPTTATPSASTTSRSITTSTQTTDVIQNISDTVLAVSPLIIAFVVLPLLLFLVFKLLRKPS